MKPYFLLLFCIILISCRRDNPKTLIHEVQKRKKLTWDQVLTDAQKDHEIYGAFEISTDSIVLLRRSYGVELSADGGKTWKWIATHIFGINEFTVDDKGVWWGLERWKGIHEPSYCILHKSMNGGKTWNTCIFNTQVFFPFHIKSLPNSPLEIEDFNNNKIYRLSGEDPHHNWQYVKQLPTEEYLADISAGEYFVSHHNNKLYVKRASGKVDTLMQFTKAWEVYQMAKSDRTIYVAGDAENGESYFASITNEHRLREYIIRGGDLDMSITQLGHIYLTCTTGAYRFNKGKIIQIFK